MRPFQAQNSDVNPMKVHPIKFDFSDPTLPLTPKTPKFPRFHVKQRGHGS